jgi:hypothetical protein
LAAVAAPAAAAGDGGSGDEGGLLSSDGGPAAAGDAALLGAPNLIALLLLLMAASALLPFPTLQREKMPYAALSFRAEEIAQAQLLELMSKAIRVLSCGAYLHVCCHAKAEMHDQALYQT